MAMDGLKEPPPRRDECYDSELPLQRKVFFYFIF